jgi:hypothetical protein
VRRNVLRLTIKMEQSMNIISNDAPMNLLPVKCIFSEETSIFDLNTFIEGLRRIEDVKAKLSHHKIPAGNLQAIILTAAHGLSLEPENLDVFRRDTHPLSTDHAGDFIRYVAALESTVDMALHDPHLTTEGLFEFHLQDFCPKDKFDLEELGIIPINFLPNEVGGRVTISTVPSHNKLLAVHTSAAST